MSTATDNHFVSLAKINVNQHTEKKNGLTYLSWPWAVDTLLRADPMATWTYGEPVKWNDTVMVFCTVTAFGKTMTAQLPVMDHRNKAIPNPDAFQVNVAMQRCLAKAISLHGIGLYIYAGEDLPLEDKGEKPEAPIGTPVPAAPPAQPMQPDTEKQLRFYATAPKSQALVEKVMAAKQFSDVSEFTEDIAKKCIAWVEEQLAKETKK